MFKMLQFICKESCWSARTDQKLSVLGVGGLPCTLGLGFRGVGLGVWV